MHSSFQRPDFTSINLRSSVGLITCLMYTDISCLEGSGEIITPVWSILIPNLLKQIGLLLNAFRGGGIKTSLVVKFTFISLQKERQSSGRVLGSYDYSYPV